MELIAGILLASLIPEESLRFRPVFEQASEASCGLAATASLLVLYCGLQADEASLAARLSELRPGKAGGLSLGDILVLLADAGLRAKAFRMDAPALALALGAGYRPILLHYSRPRPHFALLIGAGGDRFVLADPARGLEALSAKELERRWSGAAVLADRKATAPRGRGLAAAWTAAALSRAANLDRAAAATAAAAAARTVADDAARDAVRAATRVPRL